MSFVHSPKIITEGLVLSLDAGNVKSYPGSGIIWTDKSGYNNNGTLTNGPTFNSSNGGSVVFDGSNDYADFTTFTNLGNTNRSLCAWFKINTIIGSNQAIIEFPNSGSLDRTAMHLGHESNRIVTGCGGTPYNGYVYLTNTITTNLWYHVSCTISANTIVNGFLNGVLIGTATNSGPVETNPVGQIGRYNGFYGNYSNCSISSVMLYTKVLSSQEVLQNYNATKSRFNVT